MTRIRQGWALTKKSWALLRGNKELLRFPLYGALATIAVLIVTLLPGLYLIDTGDQGPGAVLTAIGLYLIAFVGVFFGVALAATADARFHGRPATVSDGVAVARSRIGAIAGWAAVSALVGTLFAALQNSGRGGEILVGSLLSAAWSLITFMAVPVIAFEGLGPFATLKRSATIFRQRWAGQVTGNVAIGGVLFLAGVLPALGLIALGIILWSSDGEGSDVAAGAVLVAIGVALLAITMLLVRALQGIFGVALYRFASDGEATAGFTESELNSAVRTR